MIVSVRAVAAHLLPVLALGVVALPALSIAYGLLIVPGILLSALWLPLAPACVAERLGPVEAIRRSAELTHGQRRVLAKTLVAVGAGFMATCVVPTACVATVLEPTGAPAWYPLVYGLPFAGVRAALLLVASALSGASYVELQKQQARDGRPARF